MSGFVDLHCHLLWGLDDGAKTPEDSLEMARALSDLGFSTVAASPHARAEYAPASLATERLAEVKAAILAAAVPLELVKNAENYLLEDGFVEELGTPKARTLGAGAYVLVEAPYQAPVPPLTEIIFRVKLKGVTPLIAHPERCMEFEKKGRAAEAVRAGALLQLDVGALVGKYGAGAKKLARTFLDQGLYAVGATDLHGPNAAREWIGKALSELRSRAGEQAFCALMRDAPAKLLRGEALES
ncbi:MAG: tyrosine-protein phosphatase [Myxococcaceae bacterium]